MKRKEESAEFKGKKKTAILRAAVQDHVCQASLPAL